MAEDRLLGRLEFTGNPELTGEIMLVRTLSPGALRFRVKRGSNWAE
jgi:hypothetical protein